MVPRIHCITDLSPAVATSTAREPLSDARVCRLLDLLEAAVRAGVDAVQIRAKHATDRALLDLTSRVIARVRPLGAAVIVNDRLDVALAADADGVHLGLTDLPVRVVRRLVPAAFLVGGTCRNDEHARQARDEGADYAGVGPVYPTSTKQGLPAPVGLAAVRSAAAFLPVVAVAGITLQRIPEVMAAGAHGVAVVAAISRAPDPARAAREIVEAVRAA